MLLSSVIIITIVTIKSLTIPSWQSGGLWQSFFGDKATAVLFALLVLRFTFIDANQMIVGKVVILARMVIIRMVIIRMRMRFELLLITWVGAGLKSKPFVIAMDAMETLIVISKEITELCALWTRFPAFVAKGFLHFFCWDFCFHFVSRFRRRWRLRGGRFDSAEIPSLSLKSLPSPPPWRSAWSSSWSGWWSWWWSSDVGRTRRKSRFSGDSLLVFSP